MSRLQNNYQRLRQEVKAINPQTKIVVVTKNQPLEKVLEVIQCGALIIGENRVQEAETKIPFLPSPLQKHLIGHLQTNKVKKAVELFDLIESVDSLHLAEKINRECARLNKLMPILLEVNTSGEPQKFGILPNEVEKIVRQIALLPQIKICGLMTIARYEENPENCRPSFRLLAELYQKIKLLNLPNVDFQYLSMGMSNDYRIALEEGSNLIRIGTGIFGKR